MNLYISGVITGSSHSVLQILNISSNVERHKVHLQGDLNQCRDIPSLRSFRSYTSRNSRKPGISKIVRFIGELLTWVRVTLLPDSKFNGGILGHEKKIGKIRFLTIYENRILKEKSFVESAYLFVSLQFSFLPPSRFII